jgi:SseB protein N-terminal domain/SseB protein C-terminal domain
MDLLARLLGKNQGDGTKVENPRLLKAMHETALNDTPENRKKLYAEFLKATLIFPTPELSAKPGKRVSNGKMTFQLVGLKDAKGKNMTTVFTDHEALCNWDPNTPSVELKARDYFEMLVPLSFEEVIINPFNPNRKMVRPGGRITRPEFEALAKGTFPESTPGLQTINAAAGTRLRFKKVDKDLPQDVMERIKETLVRFEEVQSAFALMIAFGEDSLHRAIAVRLSSAVPDERHRFLAMSVLETVRPLLAKEEAFDLLPMSATFYQLVVRTIPPFYERAEA